MAYSKKKQQKLVTSLTNIGSLAGTNRTGVADGIKGLEMGLEQNRCNEEAKAVRNGLFKVVIMGTFASGKSTVINALVGSKILPESALPSTAILTFIQYGTQEDVAYVYMEDETLEDGSVRTGECVQMSVTKFQEEYKYKPEDEIQFKEKGIVERFSKVKYAIMYCSKPLMEGGVTIIDSPGLEDKKVATELALKIAQESQAIIYVVTERGFATPDKEYIESTFHNCPNNVFFLLNKFDLVRKEDRESAMSKLKLDIKSVFTDKNGVFNEGLCERRMFGISALRALDARRKMTYDNEMEEERFLSDNECENRFRRSGFEPFEKELETFLTTDEKCIAQYQKCFSQMASTYRNAEEQINDYIEVYENQVQMDENQEAECKEIIDEILREITTNEIAFDNCSLRIKNKITEVLNGCVHSIDRSWEQDMIHLAERIDIGTFSYMWEGIKRINPLASEESKKADLEKFASKFITAVSDYFVEKFSANLEENKVVIDREIKDCQEILNIKLEGTETLFVDLANKITNRTNLSIEVTEKSWLQIIISSYLGDFSQAISGSVDGGSSWVDFIKKTIYNSLWQLLFYSLFDILALIPIIAFEFYQTDNSKSETIKAILFKLKDKMLQAIRQQVMVMCKDVNKLIAVEINQKKLEKTGDMKQRLSDEKNKMESIKAALSDHNFNLETERTRFNAILSAIYEEANEAYSVVFENQVTLEQFKTF